MPPRKALLYAKLALPRRDDLVASIACHILRAVLVSESLMEPAAFRAEQLLRRCTWLCVAVMK